LLTDVNNVSYL